MQTTRVFVDEKGRYRNPVGIIMVNTKIIKLLGMIALGVTGLIVLLLFYLSDYGQCFLREFGFTKNGRSYFCQNITNGIYKELPLDHPNNFPKTEKNKQYVFEYDNVKYSFYYPQDYVIEENLYYGYPNMFICHNKCEYYRTIDNRVGLAGEFITILFDMPDTVYDNQQKFNGSDVEFHHSPNFDLSVYEGILNSFNYYK